MAVNLKGTHLNSMADLDRAAVEQILQTAVELKSQLKQGIPHARLPGRILAMIFEKPSTRTRISFEAGILQLGGHGIVLSSRDLQLGRGETIGDTAQVLSRYVDGIMARVFAHQTVLDLAKYGSVPVINGLSDLEHPCQALGDLLTLQEHKGKLEGLHLAYVGDGNNVANSLMLAGALVGLNVSVGHPAGYAPDKGTVEKAQALAAASGSRVVVTEDPIEAVKGADAIYADVWTSMGQEGEEEARNKVFQPFQVNDTLMGHAAPDAIFMHCLPAHRGEEVSASVMDGKQSVVFDEAENRLHVQKAIMSLLMA
jgi:ornithine carbamoyltransferase